MVCLRSNSCSEGKLELEFSPLWQKDGRIRIQTKQAGLVAQSRPTLCDPMDYIAPQALLSMGFSRKEYWSGLPFPLPGDHCDLGTEPTSPASAGRFFYCGATWEAPSQICSMLKLRPYGCGSPCPWTLGRWRQPYCSTVMWVGVFIITPVDVTKLSAATLGFWQLTKVNLKSQRTCVSKSM